MAGNSYQVGCRSICGEIEFLGPLLPQVEQELEQTVLMNTSCTNQSCLDTQFLGSMLGDIKWVREIFRLNDNSDIVPLLPHIEQKLWKMEQTIHIDMY